MITDDENASLADVSLNQIIFKAANGDSRPVPSGWVYKAPEELLPDMDPSDFAPTKEMDMYSLSSTIYKVFYSNNSR